jgi:hypothetical protein
MLLICRFEEKSAEMHAFIKTSIRHRIDGCAVSEEFKRVLKHPEELRDSVVTS